ncbi:MAG: hypothetical protein K8R59_02245, partial [Thermoanaerobaculales bacterium]|nr:hypothetical protein [Thermoanaerobaculales bacterium]
ATRGRPRRLPTRIAGSAEDLPVALDARRPNEVQDFSTRASPAWAINPTRERSVSDGMPRSPVAREACWGRREAGDMSSFLELVSLLP